MFYKRIYNLRSNNKDLSIIVYHSLIVMTVKYNFRNWHSIKLNYLFYINFVYLRLFYETEYSFDFVISHFVKRSTDNDLYQDIVPHYVILMYPFLSGYNIER